MDEWWHPTFFIRNVTMTSLIWYIFRVTGPLRGEFAGDRWIPLIKPVTRTFDIFFDLRLNKWLSKQSRSRWFETPSGSLWRHCNVIGCVTALISLESTCYVITIASWCLKSPATGLFVQQLVQADIEENIKALHNRFHSRRSVMG